MGQVLTSWKEIAQFMGKGARTVQRWEQHFGLPVRRLSANSHQAVLAIPEELHVWMAERSRTRQEVFSRPEMEGLRRRLEELEQDNLALRARLEEIQTQTGWQERSQRFEGAWRGGAEPMAS